MSSASAPLDAAVVARVRASFARQGRWRLSAPSSPTSPPVASPSRCRSSRAYPSRTASSTRGSSSPIDSACGYAALTLMPDDAEVLTVELKVNLLAPAGGDSLVAEGEVVRSGRTLTVCRGEAYAEQGAERVHVATMLATMMRRRAG